MASTTRGSIKLSTANGIGAALVDKLGGTGYSPSEWKDNINLCGIHAADIETALANIEESSGTGEERGSILLSTANAIGAMLNKKFDTSRGFNPKEWASAISKLEPLPERTASGAIAHIEDGASEVPAKNWLVTLPASLSGYSAVNGTKNTGTGTPETQYTASLGRTIYGGTADIVKGEGSENCTNRNLVGDGFTWSYNTTELNFPYFTIGSNAPNKASNKNFVCEGYVNNGNYRSNLQDGEIGVFNNTTGIYRFCVRDDSCTTLEQFLEKNANTKITYEVTTPTDFTFTPINPTPETENVCNFWADEGDSSVTYRADIDSTEPEEESLLGAINNEEE